MADKTTGGITGNVGGVDLTNVKITGLASEATLAEILDKLEKMGKVSGSGTGGSSNVADDLEDLGEATEDTTDSFSKLIDTTEKETKERKKSTQVLMDGWAVIKANTKNMVSAVESYVSSMMDANDSVATQFQPIIDVMADVIGDLIAGLGKLVGGMVSLGGMIPGLGPMFTSLGGALDSLSEAAGKAVAGMIKMGSKILLEGIDKMWSMYQGASEAGVIFSGGMSELTKNMADLNLVASEYSDVMSAQAKNMNLFGAGLSGGAKSLGKLIAANKEQSVKLKELGISYKEQVDSTAHLMSVFARVGKLQEMDAKKLSKINNDYMKDLKLIQTITGKNAEEMKNERDERMLNIAYQNKLAGMSQEQVAQMEAFMAGLSPEEQKAAMQQFTTGMISIPGMILSGASKHMAQAIQKIESGTYTKYGDKAGTRAIYEYKTGIARQTKELKATMGGLKAIGDAQAHDMADAVSNSIGKSMAETMKTAREGQKLAEAGWNKVAAQTKTSTAGVAAINDEQRELSRKLLNVSAKHLPEISKLLKGISGAISTGVDFLADPEKAAKNLAAKMGIGGEKEKEGSWYENFTLDSIGKPIGHWAAETEKLYTYANKKLNEFGTNLGIYAFKTKQAGEELIAGAIKAWEPAGERIAAGYSVVKDKLIEFGTNVGTYAFSVKETALNMTDQAQEIWKTGSEKVSRIIDSIFGAGSIVDIASDFGVKAAEALIDWLRSTAVGKWLTLGKTEKKTGESSSWFGGPWFGGNEAITPAIKTPTVVQNGELGVVTNVGINQPKIASAEEQLAIRRAKEKAERERRQKQLEQQRLEAQRRNEEYKKAKEKTSEGLTGKTIEDLNALLQDIHTSSIQQIAILERISELQSEQNSNTETLVTNSM